MTRGLMQERAHTYLYLLGTDTGADGKPSRARREPPAKTARDDLPNWDGAACTDWPTDLWFTDNPDDRDHARSICDTCPHTGSDGPCATFARQATNPRIHDGIWGGVDMSIKENRQRPLRCDGPGCDKAATGRRKYCSDRCADRAGRARKKAREAAKVEAEIAAWRRGQIDVGRTRRTP